MAHGKTFLGDILSLYASQSMLQGEITARLLYCDKYLCYVEKKKKVEIVP